MDKSKDQDDTQKMDDAEVDGEEFGLMDLLERLETLREDMEDLGVTTLDEVNARIKELHQKLDLG